jgi:hypothetical protein
MGFAKAFKWAEVSQITQNISRPAGVLWLLCALLLTASALLFLLKKEQWWMIAGPAVIFSQIIIILSWSDAKFGTLVNAIILLPLIVSFLNAQPSSFRNVYKTEVLNGLQRSSDMTLVSEEDIRHLPKPVQKYLQYTGTVGKPKVQNIRAKFTGALRFKKDSKWMNIASQQYDFFDDPTRVFYIESTLYGIPFDGLHLYKGPNATMQIKVVSLFQVADAKGTKMNQGETVTLFNDMCLLAPATLIDRSIQWETINSLTAKARFTNQGNTITALLYFTEKGELINFISDDRYQSMDGKTYLNYRWSTPVKDYKDVGGRKVAAYGEALWHTPEGEFAYAKFDLVEIEYNCREYK